MFAKESIVLFLFSLASFFVCGMAWFVGNSKIAYGLAINAGILGAVFVIAGWLNFIKTAEQDTTQHRQS